MSAQTNPRCIARNRNGEQCRRLDVALVGEALLCSAHRLWPWLPHEVTPEMNEAIHGVMKTLDIAERMRAVLEEEQRDAR